jgi:hypothetical protein
MVQLRLISETNLTCQYHKRWDSERSRDVLTGDSLLSEFPAMMILQSILSESRSGNRTKQLLSWIAHRAQTQRLNMVFSEIVISDIGNGTGNRNALWQARSLWSSLSNCKQNSRFSPDHFKFALWRMTNSSSISRHRTGDTEWCPEGSVNTSPWTCTWNNQDGRTGRQVHCLENLER